MPTSPSLLRRIRTAQIRRTAPLLASLTRSSLGGPVISAMRTSQPGRRILDALTGFRRPFPTLEAAEAYARRFLPAHEHQDATARHLADTEAARPSDYPVLFYLSQQMHNPTALSHILDLGGNAGNLFYCYQRYLTLPRNVRWTVLDLPQVTAYGRKVATERGVSGLAFADSPEDLSPVDFVIASGSIHYLPSSLADFLRSLPVLPRYVVVNRTPLLDGDMPGIATVQDAGTYLTACNLLSKPVLIRQMIGLRYCLQDQWSVPELSVRVPCYPHLSVPAYSGLYFVLPSA